MASIASAVLESDDLGLAGTARTVDEALELSLRADVLVCDINLAGGAEGLHVLRSIHDPRRPDYEQPPAVLFLSAYGYPSLIRAALDGGASGFLDKSADVPEILAAIRTLASGGSVFSAAALHGSRDARRRPTDR